MQVEVQWPGLRPRAPRWGKRHHPHQKRRQGQVTSTGGATARGRLGTHPELSAVRAARHTLPFSAISLSRKVRCWSGKGQLIPGRRAQWRAQGQVRCHNRSPGWSGAGTLPCHRTRVAGRPWEEMAGSQWGPFRARTAQGSRLQQQGGGEPWEAGRWNHNKHKSPAASAGALQRTRLSFARAGHCRQLRRVPLSSQHLLQLLTPAEADEHSPRSEHVLRTNAISRRPCEAGAIRRRGSTGKLDLKGIFKPKNKRMDLPDH